MKSVRIHVKYLPAFSLQLCTKIISYSIRNEVSSMKYGADILDSVEYVAVSVCNTH